MNSSWSEVCFFFGLRNRNDNKWSPCELNNSSDNFVEEELKWIHSGAIQSSEPFKGFSMRFLSNFEWKVFFRCEKFSKTKPLWHSMEGKFALERVATTKFSFRFALLATWLGLECFMVSRLCIVACFFFSQYLLSFAVCFPNISQLAPSPSGQRARAKQQ